LVKKVVSRWCQVELEEGLLILTEIVSSSEYKSESEINTAFSPLPIYTSSSSTPPPSSSSPIDSPPFYHTMSQHNLHTIIRQQHKQLVAMQAQIQALITGGAVVGKREKEFNARSHIEVTKLSVFNREAGKVGGFITACRLYLRMKMKKAIVEEQIQWILLYIQGESANV